MTALVRFFVLRALSGRVRLAILAVVLGQLVLIESMGPGGRLPPADASSPLVAVLAFGLIGADLASGDALVVLARPLTRTAWVLAQWLAVVLLSWASSALLVGGVALTGAVGGQAPSWSDLASSALEHAAVDVGLAAVLAAFGALVRGRGGLGLWLIAVLALGGANVLADLGWLPPATFRIARALAGVLMPRLDAGEAAASAAGLVRELSGWGAATTGALLVAVALVNRRELAARRAA